MAASHFEGDCWPGRSAWVDYLLPEARAFWSSRFAADAYLGSSESLYTWNDMNEPCAHALKHTKPTDGPGLRHRGVLSSIVA